MTNIPIAHPTVPSRMELIDNDGRLIYACNQPTPRIMAGYEVYRCHWCTKYRERYAPSSYREGKYNPVSFAFHFITKFLWR